MQDLLTYTADAIALTSALYLSIGFALHLASKIAMPRHKTSPGQLELDLTPAAIAEVAPATESTPAVPAPSVEQAWADAIESSSQRQQAPELASLKPVELRKACQSKGIRWRDAHGKNKHLTKPQMIAALSA